MIEINPVPIICDAREHKRPITFSFHELEYVAHDRTLENLEKLIWYLLAIETNRDPQLACLLSYQHIAFTLRSDYVHIHRALHRLVRLGFIQVYDLPALELIDFTVEELLCMRLFMLNLPYEGLLMLKKAPVYKPSVYYQQGIFRKL